MYGPYLQNRSLNASAEPQLKFAKVCTFASGPNKDTIEPYKK